MRVLAIDPGYDRCGVAVIEKEKGRESLLFSTCVATKASDNYPERLRQVGESLKKFFADWQPNCVAIEKLFFATNRKTANQVSEVRGMIIYLAASAGLEVVEYTPLEIKQTVAGFGGANKKQVAEMVRRLVKFKKEKVLDDEYDAIAVGLTACSRLRG